MRPDPRKREAFVKFLRSSVTLFALMALAVSTANAYPRPTKIVTYKAATIKMTAKAVKGYCWATSLASQRSDAFRCISGHLIHDPCFYISTKAVGCPENIAANTGIVIRITKPLPPKNNPSNAFLPLSFRVASANGMVCSANGTGIALTAFGDYHYYCSGNMVCTVPHISIQAPTAYQVTCGTRTPSRTVKGARVLFVSTIWE